MKRKQ